MSNQEIKSFLSEYEKKNFSSYTEEDSFLRKKGITAGVVSMSFFDENGGSPRLLMSPQKIIVRDKPMWCIVLEKKQIISMPDEEATEREPRKSDLVEGRRIFTCPQ